MRLNFLRKFRRDEDGFSLVFVGVGMMAFVGVSMLAIDVGQLMTARSQAQNSADAGALVFDDWNDRTPTGPSVMNARAGSRANKVIDATVSAAPVNVEFLNDPAG